MIKFVGDICLTDNDFDIGFGVGSRISRGLAPFSNIKKGEEEIWVGNLECVLSNSTIRKGYNKACFRSAPESLRIDQLIDCYGVANNHIMEHGSEAYKETLAAIRNNGKVYVGSKDKKTVVLSDGGKRIAISSFSLRCDNTGFETEYWYAPELEEIKEEDNEYFDADYRVAYIHWGVEFVPYPYAEQQKLAHYLVDNGYDLIIGHHPHVLQGYEIYKRKYIYYSLGNCVFNMAYPDTNIGLIVSLEPITGIVSSEYLKIGRDYCPSIVKESDIPVRLKLEHLNTMIGAYPNVEQYCRASNTYLKKYRRSHHVSILRNLFKYDLAFLKGMVMNFIHERK